MIKFVYPFQVPGAEIVKASRGPAPRDHFRITTAEVEDEARATGSGSSAITGGSTATQGQLGQASVPTSPMDQGEVRSASVAAESAVLKHLA